MGSHAVSHASDREKTALGRITRPLDAFCGFQQPNARRELRLEAGVRHERTLETVSSTPLLGAAMG